VSAVDRSEEMLMGKPTISVAPALAVTLYCLSIAMSQSKDAAAKEGLVHCASIRDDDKVRGYDPSLRERTIKAFKSLTPSTRGEADSSDIDTQARYRCMDGKVMVCFVGANLPCVKINAAKDNPGADALCRIRR
jgi:hypothetical protein